MFKSLCSSLLATSICSLLGLQTSATLGGIVINEIHYDPEPKTEEVEFIELYNDGNSTVDLSNWQFDDGIKYTFPNGTTIAAGGYLLVCENPTALQTKFGVVGLGPWDGGLSNDGEEVILKNAQGLVEDEVEYGIGFPWPLASNGTGASMELINPSLDNTKGGNWRQCWFFLRHS